MGLQSKLWGLALLGLISLGGCQVKDHVYFGDPRWSVSSWVVKERYEVSKIGKTRILEDKKTGEKWKRILGSFERADNYGRRVYGVERMYSVDGGEYMEVDSLPENINTMMNGDQALGDDFEKKVIKAVDRVRR